MSTDPSQDYDATLGAIEEVNDAYPGMFRETQTYLDERIEEVISGGKEPIVVRVYGDDLTVLRTKAEEINKILAGIDGVVDQHVDISTDVPQLQVEVKLSAAARYGLKPGDVRRAAATLVAGEEVGDIFRDGKAYDVAVWSTPQTRNSVPAIENLADRHALGQPGPAGRGGQGDSGAESQLDRPRGRVPAPRRRRLLRGPRPRLGRPGPRGRLKGVEFARGYHAEVLGEYQERQAAQAQLLATAVIAAAAILLLLQAAFGAWRPALIVFVTLPMALVGGVLAALLGGGIISLGLAGRLLHRVRDRRAQRHPADQPLPASRTGGG